MVQLQVGEMVQLPVIKGGKNGLTASYKGREVWFNCRLCREGGIVQLPVIKGGKDGSTAGYK